MSRIRIPETYESETLKQLKKQLEEGEMTRLTDLLEEVEKLCDWLEGELGMQRLAFHLREKLKDAESIAELVLPVSGKYVI